MKRKWMIISLALFALVSDLVWFFGFSQTDENSTGDSNGTSLTAEIVNELAEKLVSQDQATYEAAWAHDNVPPLSPSGTTITVDATTLQSYETAGIATMTVTVPDEDPIQEIALLQQVDDAEWRIYSTLEVVPDTAARVGTTLPSEGLRESSSSITVADDEPACAKDLKLKVPSIEDHSKTPVILVHGLGSSQRTWSEVDPSMKDALSVIDGAKIVEPFDYEPVNDHWVTDLEIAQKLAKTIVCYSKLYDNDVEMVTHSMGGLAARAALDWAAYGTFAKDVTKHIVTIAPPHTGAGAASLDATFWKSVCEDPLLVATLIAGEACSEAEVARATNGLQIDSDQLAKLPKFPKGISVKTIAGHATWRVCIAWACSPGADMNGDLVVSVQSATADYTKTGKGDGKKVFTCDTDTPFAPLSSAWCEHSNMLRSKKVQQEVKESIEASLVSPQVEMTDLHGLKLPLSSEWEISHQTLNQDEKWPYSTVVKKDLCDQEREMNDYCPNFKVIDTAAYKEELSSSYPGEVGDCFWYGLQDDSWQTSPQSTEKVTIGGKSATHRTHWECDVNGSSEPTPPSSADEANDVIHSWEIGGIVVVEYFDSDDPLPGLEKLLAGAS